MSEDSVRCEVGARGEEVISHAVGGQSQRGLILFMGDVMYF